MTTSETTALRVFVSGDRAQVGKSTVCLGLIGALLRHGYAPGDIAYIKPATQCEKTQVIARFCRQQGIECCDIGPIVFYSGFTREFLKGSTDSAEQLLANVRAKVEELSVGRKIVVIDGVGYPAVGSICGVSNANVARVLQTPVVLVGKRGVGDAVDSFNLNACFFESHGVKVLGAIFNRLPLDGYYSLENCKENVTRYFAQFQPEKQVYGFLPELTEEAADVLAAAVPAAPRDRTDPMTAEEETKAKRVIEAFHTHIDLTRLLESVKQTQSPSIASVPAHIGDSPTVPAPVTFSAEQKAARTREDIQAEARASGAAAVCRG